MGGLHLTPAVAKLIDAGTTFGFMLLVIAGLCGFIYYLMGEMKESRKDFTASMNEAIKTVSEMKEILRGILHKKGD